MASVTVHARVYVCTRACMCVYVRVGVRMCAYVRVCVYSVYIWCVYVCVYVCVCVCVWLSFSLTLSLSLSLAPSHSLTSLPPSPSLSESWRGNSGLQSCFQSKV